MANLNRLSATEAARKLATREITAQALLADCLERIREREPVDSVYNISRRFFQRYDIDLSMTDGAAQRIALAASEAKRIGARALKEVYGRIIKPFEFDPFAHQEVQRAASGHRLVIDEELVTRTLRPAV